MSQRNNQRGVQAPQHQTMQAAEDMIFEMQHPGWSLRCWTPYRRAAYELLINEGYVKWELISTKNRKVLGAFQLTTKGEDFVRIVERKYGRR